MGEYYKKLVGNLGFQVETAMGVGLAPVWSEYDHDEVLVGRERVGLSQKTAIDGTWLAQVEISQLEAVETGAHSRLFQVEVYESHSDLGIRWRLETKKCHKEKVCHQSVDI